MVKEVIDDFKKDTNIIESKSNKGELYIWFTKFKLLFSNWFVFNIAAVNGPSKRIKKASKLAPKKVSINIKMTFDLETLEALKSFHKDIYVLKIFFIL